MGAASSPRYRPAGLLVELGEVRIMIDGGPRAEPAGRLDAWLVTDDRSELFADIRRRARPRGIEPVMRSWAGAGLRVELRRVIHTSHPTAGYLIHAGGLTAVWAPEFMVFPEWAAGTCLMFAEASGWNRPIRFARSAGGHLDALAVAQQARAHGVARLVFAHIGRPTIRALDAGLRPPFGEFAEDGQVFRLPLAQGQAASRRRV